MAPGSTVEVVFFEAPSPAEADLFATMTVSCRLVETDWSCPRQDVHKGKEGYRSLTGRRAVSSAGRVNFGLFSREERMSQSDHGECAARSVRRVEIEVRVFALGFGLRSAVSPNPDTCHFGKTVRTDSVQNART